MIEQEKLTPQLTADGSFTFFPRNLENYFIVILAQNRKQNASL